MNHRSITRLLTISAVAILPHVLTAFPAAAADTHRHDGHAAVLKLNQGAKWQTDAPLRTGMETIRQAVGQAIADVHSHRFDAAHSRSLAETVNKQVGYIVQNCKLQPEADDVLHAIIADIGQSVDVISAGSAPTEREQGVVRLARTLDDYAAHFDHPGWKGLDTRH